MEEVAKKGKKGRASLKGLSVPPPPRRRGRPTPAQSAEITQGILDLAAEMFLSTGYEKVTMDAIALQAGVPKTTIYKRFPDKSSLLAEVIKDRMASWSSINTQRDAALPDTLEARLAHHVASLLIWTTKPEVRAFSKLAANLPDSSDAGLMAQNLGGYHGMRSHLAQVMIDLGPKAGLAVRDPDGIAAMIMAIVAGTVFQRPSSGQIDPHEATEIGKKIVAFLVGGASSW